MNTKHHPLFSAISENETKKLTSIVKETMAFDMPDKRAFTAADLWNIQRQRRSMPQRRYFV